MGRAAATHTLPLASKNRNFLPEYDENCPHVVSSC